MPAGRFICSLSLPIKLLRSVATASRRIVFTRKAISPFEITPSIKLSIVAVTVLSVISIILFNQKIYKKSSIILHGFYVVFLFAF